MIRRTLVRIIDSNITLAITIVAFVAMVVLAVPVMFTHEDWRQHADPATVSSIQQNVPVSERVSVAIYGDSRAAFLGEGAALVPGWSPVWNEAREGCAFLAQDHIWKQYGTKSTPGERSSSEQGNGTTLTCDTRTYLPDAPHTDLAIVYAGTLLTVNGGTDSTMRSPVDGVLDVSNVGTWSAYLEDNLVQSIEAIPADHVIILATPPSYSRMDINPYWDDTDRLFAVNVILGNVAARTGATYLDTFPAFVAALPTSCQPDGSHFTVECAVRASEWIKNEAQAFVG